MSYQRERDEFFATMGAAGYHIREILGLLRAAATCERYNYLISCVEMSDKESERAEKRNDVAELRAKKILEAHGHMLVTSGDPRGYALRVGGIGKYNTMEGEESGYGIPTRQI
jgi:hypothetical protein